MPHSGRGIGLPATALEQRRGRADDCRVHAHARHCGEGHPVGIGEIDPALVLAEPDGERGRQPGWHAQRPGGQVGRAARNDRQRNVRASDSVRAGPDGTVTANGEDNPAPARTASRASPEP